MQKISGDPKKPPLLIIISQRTPTLPFREPRRPPDKQNHPEPHHRLHISKSSTKRQTPHGIVIKHRTQPPQSKISTPKKIYPSGHPVGVSWLRATAFDDGGDVGQLARKPRVPLRPTGFTGVSGLRASSLHPPLFRGDFRECGRQGRRTKGENLRKWYLVHLFLPFPERTS